VKAVNFFEGVGASQQARHQRFALRRGLTDKQRRVQGQFGHDYFESEFGYGGYRYDGRYGPVAERIIQHYGLGPGSRVLDVGCAKGFLAFEFQKRLCHAFGCDISAYALEHGKEEVRSRLFLMSAHRLGFPDAAFDLVVSVDTIHNLPEDLADVAIREMVRVSRGKCFVQLASYSSAAEEEAFRVWGVTAQTFRSIGQWLECFERTGYGGEYWLKVFT
jgi:SAM-dependent methyltransferase